MKISILEISENENSGEVFSEQNILFAKSEEEAKIQQSLNEKKT